MRVEIYDSQDLPRPQDRVVAQALASRSLKPFGEHLSEMNNDKTTTFYEKNIIGFGHDNINSCGDGIIVSLPEISILAAKYVEDSPLFNGQESSTRYIDFKNRSVVAQTDEGKVQAQKSLDLFNRFFEDEVDYNCGIFNPNTDVEQKAVKAYTLDVMRSILPAGLTTNVNWVTNLRQVQDHTQYLKASFLQEVKDIGSYTHMALDDKYPGLLNKINYNAIDHIWSNIDEYGEFSEDPVYNGASVWDGYDPLNQKLDISYIEDDLNNIKQYQSLCNRPRGCPPPRIYSSPFVLAGLMDFGSFRDLQRQRNGICKIPLLNTYNGFEEWYLSKMSDNLKHEVLAHLDNIEHAHTELQDPYIVPLGYRVPFIYQCGFEQLIYISELRSSKYVHPTCRALALCIGDFIHEKLPQVALHIDDSPLDHFSFKRGNHTISNINE